MTENLMRIVASAVLLASAAGCIGVDYRREVPREVPRRQTTSAIRGTLDAAEWTPIACAVEGQHVLRRIAVEDGQHVREGDLLAELDLEAISSRIEAQQVEVLSAEAALQNSRAELNQLTMLAAARIEQAELELDLAEGELRMYREGTHPMERKGLEMRIGLAEARLKLHADEFLHAEVAFKEDEIDRGEFERLRLAAEEARTELGILKLELEVLVTYEHEHQLKRLMGELVVHKSEARQAALSAEAEKHIHEAQYRSAELHLAAAKENLERLQQQMERERITAPRDGQVFLGRDDTSSLAEGATVREGQALFRMPTGAGMVARIPVSVELRNQVARSLATGAELSARVRIDALNGRVFSARLEGLDRDQTVDAPQLGILHLEDPSTGLRPGMSCTVEFRFE